MLGVLGPLGLACVRVGSPALDVLAGAGCAIGAAEAAALARLAGVPVSIPRTAVSALLVTRGAPAGAVAIALSGDGAATTLGGSDHAGPVTALIAFAVGGPLNAGLRLREAENGRAWLTWGMATTWLADAAAYLVGPRMGGPSLPASINARKTWLGYVPGM